MMTDELRTAYVETFRLTDARSVVKYDDMLTMLDEAGFTEEFCEQKIKDCEDYKAMAEEEIKKYYANPIHTEPKLACQTYMQIVTAGQDVISKVDDLIESLKTPEQKLKDAAPKIPEGMVNVFQTKFIENVKADADLLLLNTL